MNKQADSNALPAALAASGLGALLGYGSSYISNNQKKHKLRNTLIGATALPALYLGYKKLNPESKITKGIDKFNNGVWNSLGYDTDIKFHKDTDEYRDVENQVDNGLHIVKSDIRNELEQRSDFQEMRDYYDNLENAYYYSNAHWDELEDKYLKAHLTPGDYKVWEEYKDLVFKARHYDDYPPGLFEHFVPTPYFISSPLDAVLTYIKESYPDEYWRTTLAEDKHARQYYPLWDFLHNKNYQKYKKEWNDAYENTLEMATEDEIRSRTNKFNTAQDKLALLNREDRDAADKRDNRDLAESLALAGTGSTAVALLLKALLDKRRKNKKEASYIKRAGLDNTWVKVNPETRGYGVGYSKMDDNEYFPISPYGFRGKLFDDLVTVVTDGKYNLYGRDFADKGGQNENWTTNKDCKAIYKKLKGLSSKKLQKLRNLYKGIYTIPEDKDVFKFIDQFKKHVDAGHSLLADY